MVNVVDAPQGSNFIVPSVVRRGDVCIAISTGGRSPALSRKIRTQLEQSLAPEYASLALLLSEVRRELKKRLTRLGIGRTLEKAGIKPGDKVRCGTLEWEW